MKNKKVTKPIPKKTLVKKEISLSYALILLMYAIIPVITPNFYTLDTAGVKFLSISLVNLVSFLILIATPGFRQNFELRSGFFKTLPGIAYFVLILFTLLSFISAINLNESLINFSKALTVLIATYILYVVFSAGRKYLDFIALILVLILLTDCISVFYNMLNYIGGGVGSIMDIKSVYSHKNILASSIFVKIPAAIYMMFYSKGWQRILGYISGLCAVLGTLLLSTRAFYLGMVFLILALFVYAFLRYRATKIKGPMVMIGRWVGMFILAVIIYSAAQQFLFPKNTDTIWNTSIVSRLQSIRADESSTNARLSSWKRSVRLIKENPVLGVGTGNWKVQVLKYENPTLVDFVYMYKNHNDFLEITAETGIIGGLAFISIFLLIIVGFARSCLVADPEHSKMKFLFLPAFGMIAYAVDAFFNFPADRPEIQALFAIYVGLAVAAFHTDTGKDGKREKAGKLLNHLNRKSLGKTFGMIFLVVLMALAYLLFLNVKSLRFQRFVKEDLAKNSLSHSSDMIIAGFPSIPDLTVDGEPIAVNKARYLLNEQKFREAINMLLSDHSSPYDTRREYFLTMAYQNIGMPDSAIHYIRKSHTIKPLNAKAARVLSSLLWDKGKKEEAILIMDTLLQRVRNNTDSWIQAVNYQLNERNTSKAITLLDSALKYLPYDTTIVNQRKRLDYVMKRGPHEAVYSKAVRAFTDQRYAECLVLLNEFINKEPGLPEAYQMRAYCLYYANQYEKSMNDINQFFAMGEMNYYLLNLRGINLRALNRFTEACQDFKTAMDNGNPDGLANYKAYCLQ
ncbi:MAG: O-antigen ligase family protein [Bacteroidales bacterium]